MKVSWKTNKKLKPQVILDRLRKCSSVGQDGRVSFNGFDKFELDSVLFTMIEFHKTFSYHTAQQIYSRGLSAWVASEGTTADKFLESLKAEVLVYNKQVPEDFVLVTSISAVAGFPLRKIKLEGGVIESCPRGLPKKYETRTYHDKRWKSSSPHLPDSYCPVLVRFKSKNPMDGVEHALYELDFVRGIFSLDVNSAFSISLAMQTFKRAPINKLTLGGMHSLHQKSGKLQDKNIFWYDPNYSERKSLELTGEKNAQAVRFFEFVIGALSRHKDAHIIKDAIVRYVRAFDEVDKNSTVQRAWAALESMMAPGENNTDLIVGRCSFLYAEREYYRQVLEHVKEYRNRNVHLGHAIEDPSPHCYQIQKFFRQALIFHLREVDNFKGLQESNKFLDSSDSIVELGRQRDLIDKVISFITPP